MQEEKNNEKENDVNWEAMKNIVYGWNTETNEPSGIEIVPDEEEELIEEDPEIEQEILPYVLNNDSLVC